MSRKLKLTKKMMKKNLADADALLAEVRATTSVRTLTADETRDVLTRLSEIMKNVVLANAMFRQTLEKAVSNMK